MTKLLSINADAKTIKGNKKGYITAIQYLSPYKDSGVNLCPNAKNAAPQAQQNSKARISNTKGPFKWANTSTRTKRICCSVASCRVDASAVQYD